MEMSPPSSPQNIYYYMLFHQIPYKLRRFLSQIRSKHHHSHPTNLAERRQMAALGKDLLIRCLIPEVWELGHPKH